MDKPLTIGVLARESGVNLETIRFYERSGLLPPPQRSAAGYRHYQAGDVRRLRFIRRGRELGFSLEEIRSLLDLAAHPESPCASADQLMLPACAPVAVTMVTACDRPRMVSGMPALAAAPMRAPISAQSKAATGLMA